MGGFLLGIDTGGTYTDGVLLDEQKRTVIASAKALTTHADLTIGILNVLDQLVHQPQEIKLVSISTTLATNALVEGKFRAAALFLLGYDKELISKFRLNENFGTPHVYYFRGGHDLNGKPQAEPEWELIVKQAEQLASEVEAFAVSGYYSILNAEHEKQACELISQAVAQPIICGHQLSTRLDSVKRATTAVLNASLISINQQFIRAIQDALQQRGIQAPLMVVRGDGSLMSVGYAAKLPVETIHSGPAASAIGGHFLAQIPKGLVIDIGGTTTDIAVVDKGRCRIAEEGTTVGKYHTSIRSAYVHSFGLGGDSQISVAPGKRIHLGHHRVVPLAYLAQQFPSVADEIRTLDQHSTLPIRTTKLLEYWFVMRPVADDLVDERARQAIACLQKGPKNLSLLLKELGFKDVSQLGGENLIKHNILSRAALTPTDLLHASGEFTAWDYETARHAVHLFAQMVKMPADEFIASVKRLIAEKIVMEVVHFLSGMRLKDSEYPLMHEDLGRWLYDENLTRSDPYLGCDIYLKMPIIGLGAPAKAFLPAAAEMLHTEVVFPPYCEVANAVGAVSASVIAYKEAQLKPKDDLIRYTLQTAFGAWEFNSLQEAEAFGVEQLSKQAKKEAESRGASNPHIEVERVPCGLGNYRLEVIAAGNPLL